MIHLFIESRFPWALLSWTIRRWPGILIINQQPPLSGSSLPPRQYLQHWGLLSQDLVLKLPRLQNTAREDRERLPLCLVLSLTFRGGKSLQMLLKFPKGPQCTPHDHNSKRPAAGPDICLPETVGVQCQKQCRVWEPPCLLQFLFSWESHFYFIIIIIIL